MPARWIATIIAASVLVPVAFTTGAYTLPLHGPGGIATGVLVSTIAWLLAPHLETIGGEHRWRVAGCSRWRRSSSSRTARPPSVAAAGIRARQPPVRHQHRRRLGMARRAAERRARWIVCGRGAGVVAS
jgi:hypothetical protein